MAEVIAGTDDGGSNGEKVWVPKVRVCGACGGLGTVEYPPMPCGNSDSQHIDCPACRSTGLALPVWHLGLDQGTATDGQGVIDG